MHKPTLDGSTVARLAQTTRPPSVEHRACHGLESNPATLQSDKAGCPAPPPSIGLESSAVPRGTDDRRRVPRTLIPQLTRSGALCTLVAEERAKRPRLPTS